jgi:hypothetical protein
MIKERRLLVFLLARFRIADYETWKAAFDDEAETRIRHGAKGHRVFRGEEDENALTVLIEFASRGGAVSLAEDDVSVLYTIRRADIEGGPHGGKWQIDYLDEVDTANYEDWPYP